VPEVLEARASEARQASGGAADGAMISAALRGGSCASVLESGDEGDSYESVWRLPRRCLYRRVPRQRAPQHRALRRRDFAKGLFEGTSSSGEV